MGKNKEKYQIINEVAGINGIPVDISDEDDEKLKEYDEDNE